MALMALVLSIAVPRYSMHLTQLRRLEAKSALIKLSSAMETYYLEHNSYSGVNLSVLKMPEYIARNSYRLVIANNRGRYYQLQAIPQNTQITKDPYCGILSLNSLGARAISGSAGVLDCW